MMTQLKIISSVLVNVFLWMDDFVREWKQMDETNIWLMQSGLSEVHISISNDNKTTTVDMFLIWAVK